MVNTGGARKRGINTRRGRLSRPLRNSQQQRNSRPQRNSTKISAPVRTINTKQSKAKKANTISSNKTRSRSVGKFLGGEPVTKITYKDGSGRPTKISFQQKGRNVSVPVRINSLGNAWKNQIAGGGKGKFTAAVGFGKGFFQDVSVSYNKGRITKLTKPSSLIGFDKEDPREKSRRIKGEVKFDLLKW